MASSLRMWLGLLTVALVGAGVSYMGISGSPSPGGGAAALPAVTTDAGYADPATCASCHEHEHATWHASHHSAMTRVASAQSIEADFDDVNLAAFGQTYHLTVRDGKHWVELDDPDAPRGGQRVVREIILVTGSHHKQVYWFATGRARTLGMLPFVYLRAERMWIPYPHNMIVPPADLDAHQPTPTGMWNAACIACHTTGGQPRAIDQHTADSAVAALTISCQACHGPGAAHVAHHRDNPDAKVAPARDVIVPARLPRDRASQVCGRCHSEFEFHSPQAFDRYLQTGVDYRPGDDLHEALAIASLDRKDQPPFDRIAEEQPYYFESKFWPDGQTRVSGREYNGMTLSRCFIEGGLSCMSCHEMHQSNADARTAAHWADDQLAAGMRGDRACLQCHDDFADRIAEHAHHPVESSGARCMNCHMPHTSYGLLKASRSHTIDSPSVATTIATGRLNACNLCHLDKTLIWTAQKLHDWYGHAQPELPAAHRAAPAVIVHLLSGDAAQRALAAWHMGWPDAVRASDADWALLFLAQTLMDPVVAVRLVAWRAIRRHEGFADQAFAPFAPPRQRAAVVQSMMRAWRADHRAFKLTDVLEPATRDNGETLFRTLHEQRDDRPLFLGE